GEKFPDDPHEQFWGGIEAVFKSWNGRRARSYRRIEGIPDEWGTAVNVQAMVYGHTGDLSATGVAFTRNPATGKNLFFGEWLKNAQGEDVVAGTRTPNPLNETTRRNESEHLESLETFLPEVYRELDNIRKKLELHYRDMQDIEFTIENKHLWMLQTRTGKRNGQAAIQMAVDMVREKLITRKEAVLRIHPDQIDELLHPNLDPGEEHKLTAIAHGLPAGPGGGYGQIVFTADEAEAWAKAGKKVILLREETSPEDVHGMHSAEAILTARGGMTSHAALVARGWGKCCIVGCSVLDIDLNEKTVTIKNVTLKEGDWLSLNGNNGNVYVGKVPLLVPDPNSNQAYHKLMSWADEFRTLKIRTNAESPADAAKALEFGAEGIGLCRTEHMFFETDRIKAIRKMILADNKSDRRSAVMELLPYQREDFKGILKVMQGRPVTIRLLDPPLHEFINLDDDQIDSLARELGVTGKKIKTRISALHEINPMLGHRGCRLGIVYPEITEMQSRAIFEAAAELTKAGIKVLPEIMIPLVGTHAEYLNQEKIVRDTASIVQKEMGQDFDYLVGTMIELPRACLTADNIAKKAEFFSFGTNDLTQTTFGYSRDDIGVFLTDYLDNKILRHDPFQSLDIRGVGQLMEIGVNKGRSVRPDLKIGICGEHGGDPDSIEFCFKLGLNYVSCSPFRVPVARLAAAQSFLRSDG
ncbi:MAG: pyruvate, phosphate dikinase, partial [Candidatus Neomarinimicrobiota bacterium]